MWTPINTVDSNTSVTTAEPSGGNAVPIFGYPGPIFYVIHISAHVCMTITICISISILVLSLQTLKHQDKTKTEDHKRKKYNMPSLDKKEPGIEMTSSTENVTHVKVQKLPCHEDFPARATRKTFWKRPLADRIVVYLACTDLTLSMFHSIGL